MNKENMHIAIGFDNNYIMQYGIALLSLCKNTDAHIVFHAILSGSVTKDNMIVLSNLVEKYGNDIIFYPIDDSVFSDMPETAHVNKASYNRLFIPDTVPENVHKILYIDGDIICLDSLLPLWNTELEGNTPLAAVFDTRAACVKVHNNIEIPLNQIYYNNGVLLFNLDVWRKENISQKCLDYIVESQCPWMDQDAVNHVIGSRIKRLHPRYNLQMAFVRQPESEWHIEKKFFQEVYEAKEHPVILHYSEGEKPWQKKYSHAKEWLYYKEMSPWKDAPLYPALFRPQSIYMIDKAYQADADAFELNAPAYFMFFSKTARKYPFLLKGVNKILWILSRIL